MSEDVECAKIRAKYAERLRMAGDICELVSALEDLLLLGSMIARNAGAEVQSEYIRETNETRALIAKYKQD